MPRAVYARCMSEHECALRHTPGTCGRKGPPGGRPPAVRRWRRCCGRRTGSSTRGCAGAPVVVRRCLCLANTVVRSAVNCDRIQFMFQIHVTSVSSLVPAGNRRALQYGFRKPPHAAQVTGGRRAIGGAGESRGNGVTSAPSGTPTAAAASRLDSTCRTWEAWALEHGSLGQGLGFRAHITDLQLATAGSPQPSQCASCACMAKLENANGGSPRWTSYRQWPQPRQRPAVAAPAALMRTAAPAQTSVAAAARACAAAPAARSACVCRKPRFCTISLPSGVRTPVSCKAAVSLRHIQFSPCPALAARNG